MLPDHLFTDCLERGTVKVNINSWARVPQMKVWKEELQKDTPLPDMYEAGMKAFEEGVTKFMNLFKSSGKA
jgi:fructose-bisphosphate aldolase, class II